MKVKDSSSLYNIHNTYKSCVRYIYICVCVCMHLIHEQELGRHWMTRKYIYFMEASKPRVMAMGLCIRKNPRTVWCTWRLLQMVKSQANTAVFSLTVSIPNIHVTPSRGSKTSDALNISLQLYMSNKHWTDPCDTLRDSMYVYAKQAHMASRRLTDLSPSFTFWALLLPLVFHILLSARTRNITLTYMVINVREWSLQLQQILASRIRNLPQWWQALEQQMPI